MHRPKVKIICAGGTLFCRSPDPLDVIDYASYDLKLAGAELVALLPPQLHKVFAIETASFSTLNSTDFGLAHWIDLARAIDDAFREDLDLAGVVVTHGTSTLEETGYMLNLVLGTDRPVVITGAQRPASALSADGPMNLAAAIRTAGSPAACGRGVLIVMNDEIHAARHVTKGSASRLHAFHSWEAGPLGAVDGDGPYFNLLPLKRHTQSSVFTIDDLVRAPRVDIAYSHAGSDGVAVRAFVGAGAAGIVSAGMLPGRVPTKEREALREALDTGCVIVQSGRGSGSRIVPCRTLHDAGFVAADSLNPQKARILLMLALARNARPSELERYFSEY